MNKFLATLSILSVLFFFTPFRANAAITYATWNSSDNFVTLSNGDLTATVNGAWNGVRATVFKTSGKHYWEYTVAGCSPNNGDIFVGVDSTSGDISDMGSVTTLDSLHLYGNSGQYLYNGTGTGADVTRKFVNGDVIGIGLDMDTPTAHFYKNGTELNASPIAQVTGASMTAETILGGTGGCNITANFGASAFAYSVPSGYNAGLYSGSAEAPFQLWPFFLF